ncbi:MAG: acyl-CoA desaturase, partial [Phycisphaerales bacterium]
MEWHRIMLASLLVIGSVHLIALLAFVPWLFSWTALITCIICVHLFGQSITIG